MDELCADKEIGALPRPCLYLHENKLPGESENLLETCLTLKLNQCWPSNELALGLARKRLAQEMTAIRRDQLGEYFLALDDVVSLADQQGTGFWCIWEPLNRSLVAHLLGANPLNPITWLLSPPKWVEDRGGLHSHLTMMLHVSEEDSSRLRIAAVEKFSELGARKLGLLPEPQDTTSSDKAVIESRPAHIALWGWRDMELRKWCLDLINCHYGTHVELEEIPLDLTEIFNLFYQGHTLGLFHIPGVPSSYFESAFQKLRPRDLRELAVIFGHYSPKGIPSLEAACKRLSTFPASPEQDVRRELRRQFSELPNPAQALSSAWFAYQMAWLKVHYPHEFYSALTTFIASNRKAMSAMSHEIAARSL